jgi:cytochrome c-type biogenesis protein CcsB
MTSTTLSFYSDVAFQATMAAYLVALLCYSAEFAARKTKTAGAELVTAAATGDATSHPPVAVHGDGGYGLVVRPPRPEWADRLHRAATGVTCLGFALQVVSLVTRGASASRVPWGNMYEFTSMITVVIVGAWLVISVRSGLRSTGFFVMLPATVLVFLAGTVLYTDAASLQPALQSYWLVIHVFAVSISSGVLLIAGCLSVMYLIALRSDRSDAHGITAGSAGSGGASVDVRRSLMQRYAERLPSAAALDRIAYRTTILAFPIYTFAVIAGALWAEVAWGRYWAWDPKETCAFITWVLYAGYLHARATAGWRGRRAAWIAVIGAVSIVFNLFFINMVIAGLHSYAGLN